jgi:hypothetical protein
MLRSFPNIVKQILKGLPMNDYPVLHSCLFFQIWLTCILDKSLTSMRDLFYLLNHSGITVDISTFSKACKPRCDQYFRRIYLDRLITKSRNGVMLQIYMILIGYMILQLMEIPVFYGKQLLDKLRYLQLELRQRCSIVHWSYDFLPEALVS